jgi:hypothetical protein
MNSILHSPHPENSKIVTYCYAHKTPHKYMLLGIEILIYIKKSMDSAKLVVTEILLVWQPADIKHVQMATVLKGLRIT